MWMLLTLKRKWKKKKLGWTVHEKLIVISMTSQVSLSYLPLWSRKMLTTAGCVGRGSSLSVSLDHPQPEVTLHKEVYQFRRTEKDSHGITYNTISKKKKILANHHIVEITACDEKTAKFLRLNLDHTCVCIHTCTCMRTHTHTHTHMCAPSSIFGWNLE
jgi:hypothetical protein